MSEMRHQKIRGLLFALLAAVCFGFTTPIIGWTKDTLGPFSVSAILSVGMVAGAILSSTFGINGPPLPFSYLPRLIVTALFGVVFAPALLAYGLSHANGIAVCLLLNLEAPFTALLAVIFYRERTGWRFLTGISLITLAAILLMSDESIDEDQLHGLIALSASTAMWAADAALTKPLADYNSSDVIFLKGVVGGAVAGLLASGFDAIPSGWQPMAGVAVCGLVGHGAMERFYLAAQRMIGVARTSSIFSIYPFFGAGLALLGGAPLSESLIATAGLMAIGVFFHAIDGDHPQRT